MNSWRIPSAMRRNESASCAGIEWYRTPDDGMTYRWTVGAISHIMHSGRSHASECRIFPRRMVSVGRLLIYQTRCLLTVPFDQKRWNRMESGRWVLVEHAIGGIKHLGVVSQVFRSREPGFDDQTMPSPADFGITTSL